jgi:hypothetical protein
VEPSEANRLHADLVAAFFHPPRIVECGFEGFADREVTIVSHVEWWPWRTVVCGSVTRSGSIGYNEGLPSESDSARQDFTWFREWSLVDDVGTDYHQVGAGRSGDGFCSDVDVRFRTPVPPEATRLTITTPGGHRIEVPL